MVVLFCCFSTIFFIFFFFKSNWVCLETCVWLFGQSHLYHCFIICICKSDHIGREVFSFPFSDGIPFVNSIHLWAEQQVWKVYFWKENPKKTVCSSADVDCFIWNCRKFGWLKLWPLLRPGGEKRIPLDYLSHRKRLLTCIWWVLSIKVMINVQMLMDDRDWISQTLSNVLVPQRERVFNWDIQ